jgi:O-antigen ligase
MKRNGLLSEKIFITLLCALVCSFPYEIRISSFISILLSVYWVFNIDSVRLTENLKSKDFWISQLLFLMTIVGVVFSDDKNFFPIEKKLSLLVFPIIFSSIKFKLKSSEIAFVLFCFIISCTFGSLYSLVIATNKPESFRLNSELTEITASIGISHVYFGLYLAFCIICILNFKRFQKQYSVLSIVFFVLLIIYLFWFMFILGGKMAIIALITLIFFLSATFLFIERKFYLGVFLLVIPIVTFYSALKFNQNVKSRFEYLFDTKNYFVGDNAWNSIGVRISILNCVKEVFDSAPIFGTGVGDVQDELNRCYNSNNFKSIHDMNPHNQYLQILLGNGLIGFVLYIGSQVFLLVNSYRTKNYLLCEFILLFSFCCLTESLLERQQGVMFFSFFSSFLFFNEQNIIKSQRTT